MKLFRATVLLTGTSALVAAALYSGAGLVEAQEGLRVPASELEDVTVPIADPRGSMRHFYRRLKLAAQRRPGVVARAGMYGESTNAADRVTSALRSRLQSRFGDGGKGFLPVAPGWEVQRHQDVEWRHEGPWRTWVVNRRNGPEDCYGLGGVLSENRNHRSRAYFGTATSGRVGRSVSRYSLFFQRHPEGGAVELRVDGGSPARVSTQASAVEDDVFHLEISDGPHELELRPVDEQPNRLYGVALEREGPGVVVDGLMLVGAFTRVLGHFDADHWAGQVEQRELDLVMFWLGGNDATSRSTGFNSSRFIEDFTRSVRRALAERRDASCLIVSVLDSTDTEEGAPRTFSRVPRVVAAQEEVAEATGCAFLNLYEAAGGRNSMLRWRRRGLASGDYKHLTARGAERVGDILYRAILWGYDEFLAAGG